MILVLIAELLMAFATIAALVILVARVAWQIIYYVLDCRNPIGKTAAVSVAALWVISAGFLAVI